MILEDNPLAEENYPPTFLRGIPNKGTQYFDSQGNVLGYIFRQDDQNPPEAGAFKISINWEDDHIVEGFTLNTRRDDGTLHYKGGVARVSLEKINSIRQEAPFIGTVGYNREPLLDQIPQNPYHGNLLLNAETVLGSFRKAFFRRLKFAIQGDIIPPIQA